jgi:hypothetical protein
LQAEERRQTGTISKKQSVAFPQKKEEGANGISLGDETLAKRREYAYKGNIHNKFGHSPQYL